MNTRLLLLAALGLCLPHAVLAQQGGVARDNINALIEEQAKAQGVPASFVHKVVKRESNYNPNARGGSALGLMQIKHATARGLGYKGDAVGLYDPATNLRYGIAYLAGAYRTAKGDLARAYGYYNKGYYYAGKREGTLVAGLDPTLPVAASSSESFGASFGAGLGLRPAVDPNVTAANTALAYAPASVAAPAPTERVEVPLPPRRPASLSNGVAVAEAVPAPAAAETAAASAQAAAETVVETVEVPLPPRRPSLVLLAAVGRPAPARKPTGPAPVQEASAVAPSP